MVGYSLLRVQRTIIIVIIIIITTIYIAPYHRITAIVLDVDIFHCFIGL